MNRDRMLEERALIDVLGQRKDVAGLMSFAMNAQTRWPAALRDLEKAWIEIEELRGEVLRLEDALADLCRELI